MFTLSVKRTFAQREKVLLCILLSLSIALAFQALAWLFWGVSHHFPFGHRYLHKSEIREKQAIFLRLKRCVDTYALRGNDDSFFKLIVSICVCTSR
jgi:hypothetical protein